MICPVCNRRKGKRFCPAKSAEICSICCGAQREVTIDCPFDCKYLLESRERDYGGGIAPRDFPYKDIRIDESYLQDHADLLEASARAVLDSCLSVPGAVDRDARDMLDAMIRTYQTAESGLYYETKPEALPARAAFDRLREAVKEFEQEEKQRSGFTRNRSGDYLRILVFLYRMALDRDNGRVRGRAFLDFLRQHFQPQSRAESQLIVPGV